MDFDIGVHRHRRAALDDQLKLGIVDIIAMDDIMSRIEQAQLRRDAETLGRNPVGGPPRRVRARQQAKIAGHAKIMFDDLGDRELRSEDRRGERDKSIVRSEEQTSELQSLMRISYAVFCLKQKKHM